MHDGIRAARLPAHAVTATRQTQQMFREMLRRLCLLTEVPEADHGDVLESQALRLGGTAIALRLDEWSGFVKVYMDVAEPAPAAAPDLYRYLLEQQLYLSLPLAMVPGLHPESKRIVLYGGVPLPEDADGDRDFLAFLNGCVKIAELWRSHWNQLA
jgi:hypothetical protein